MISVKGGTQTWSKAPQEPSYKSDGVQHISAGDSEKYFDSEAIGDTLNKVADPNWVDPSKKMRAVGNNQLGKDAFMNLLLTQMKNQDPTNPMKSHEMAAQLAQFTSLEKLNNINEGIEKLRKDNRPDHNFQALAFIGKSVSMDNSKIARTDENESHQLHFNLAADAMKANIEIKDANGNVVRTMEMKNLKSGVNQLTWNGKSDDGTTCAKGDYTLAVEAIGSNGKKIYAQTKAEGIITGVNFTAHGPELLIGKQVISLADVKSISDPNVHQLEQALGAQAGVAKAGATPGSHMIPIPKPGAQRPEEQMVAERPRKVEVKPETKPNSAKRARLSKGNLNDAAMTQGLINKINKEGGKAGMG